MVGKTFTYLVGSDAAALLFNSKNENLNAEDVYGKLVTPVFGKGVCYDVPNPVRVWFHERFGIITVIIIIITHTQARYLSHYSTALLRGSFKYCRNVGP